MKKKPLIVAHRGASYYQKENTLESFLLAKKKGADGVEMDVRQTKDGVLVLSHDRGVRMGRRRFWIDKIDYQKLKEITKGEIVRLKEVIRKIKDQRSKIKAVFLLDLKQERMETEIAKVLRKYKVRKVFVSSTNIWVLKKIKECFPQATLVLSYHPEDKRDLVRHRLVRGGVLFIYFLLKPFLFKLIKRRTAKGIEVASLNRRLVSPKIVEFFHSQKIKVFVWDVDKERQIKKMLKMGVDGIITKRPDLLKQVLEIKKLVIE